MASQAFCRIDGVIAAESNQAAIFRRGPSRWTQLLVWDLNSDQVIPGQWLKARVYSRRCDVSPDGRYLVIAAADHSSKNVEECGWTAISRSPYFTALALWFMGSAWNGGGIWKGNRELIINNFAHGWEERIAPSRAVKVRKLNLPSSEDEPIFTMRLREKGWKVVREYAYELLNPDFRDHVDRAKRLYEEVMDPMFLADRNKTTEWFEAMVAARPHYKCITTQLMEKPFVGGRLERESADGLDRWSIFDNAGVERRTWRPELFIPQWVDVDGRGRIVFGDKGCLWAWDGFPGGEPKVIADLNGNRFEPIEAPEWAREW